MKQHSIKISGKSYSTPEQKLESWRFEHRPGGWIIATSESGKRIRFCLSEAQGRLSASTQGKLWWGEWIKKSYASHSNSGGSSDQDLVAQFPGKVRKILVSPGDLVQEGDVLLLVEAMKMEFAIRAPSSGKVQKLCVQEGQQLSPGDRYLDFQ